MAWSVGSPTVAGVGGEPPKAPVIPPYKSAIYEETPYDEDKIRLLTQEQSAGAVRGLRSAVQRIIGESSDDPTRRMTLRQALAGYGEGMQNAMSSASRSARNAYNTEYNIKENTNRMNFSNAESARQLNYNTEKERQYSDYNALLAKYYKTLDKNTGTGSSSNSNIGYYAGSYDSNGIRAGSPGYTPFHSSGSIYTDETGPNSKW